MNATSATNAGNGSRRNKKAANDVVETPESSAMVRVAAAESVAELLFGVAGSCASWPLVCNVELDVDGVHVNAPVASAVESVLFDCCEIFPDGVSL